MTTITFLGERQDITDPEAAVLVAGQTTERQCSIRHQPVDDPSGHTHLRPQRGSRLSRWQGGGFRLGGLLQSHGVRLRPPSFQPVRCACPRSRALYYRSVGQCGHTPGFYGGATRSVGSEPFAPTSMRSSDSLRIVCACAIGSSLEASSGGLPSARAAMDSRIRRDPNVLRRLIRLAWVVTHRQYLLDPHSLLYRWKQHLDSEPTSRGMHPSFGPVTALSPQRLSTLWSNWEKHSDSKLWPKALRQRDSG